MRSGRAIRLLAVFVLGALASAPIGSAAAGAPERALSGRPLAPSGRVEGTKAATSRLAKTSQSLLGRTDAALVPVVIKLDYDSLATYSGGVAGLQATSPSVTGRPLSDESLTQQRYSAYIAGKERAFTTELARRVPQARVGVSLRVVYGGVAAQVPANRIADVLSINDVVAVQSDALLQPLTDSSPEFLGANTIYDALGTTANAGEGVIFANLDTGVWPEHPSFADLGNLPAPPGPSRACEFGDNPLTPAVDPFVCQNKLIGGAAFTDTYDALVGDDLFQGLARDSNGHGTHTASTAAGNIDTDVEILGSELADIHGLAPGAYVMAYKVCGPQGCFDSDSAAAVGQAIVDGVDVINFSISGGTDPFGDPVELAFLDAYAAGVFVSASAGNEGPGAGTVNHLSPWVTTVAASTQTREFATTLTVTADGGDVFSSPGASITPGVDPAAPIVLASDAPYSNALCTAPAPAGSFAGKVVACQRGVNARVEKGFNVLQGGAAGMVLYNAALADVETDTHWLPTVHLADGTSFVAFMSSHVGEVASFPAGTAGDGQGDVMAAFSSRGPGGMFIKPDVTAPGVQILAGDSPIEESPESGPPGEYFQAIAGTSMSSPHTAGAAVLLRALHTGWTPGQVRSALMTTALTDVVKEDLTTPADPFDLGAGRIDLHYAGGPVLTFDETAENMALLGADPVNAVQLNIPSIDAPVVAGELTAVRTATNTSGGRVTYRTEATSPTSSEISVHPAQFTLDAGQSIDLTITIASDAPTAQYFGEVRLVPKSASRPTLHLPVAFVTGQGTVSLISECSPEEIARQAVSTCEITAQNNSFSDATAAFNTKVNNDLKVVGASGATVVDKRTVTLSDVTLAGAQPGVPSVDPGALFGYIPLDIFGVEPIPVGDEDIVNFSTPAYVYNGVTYDAIGVDSNGYVLAGGGTSEDNNCCNLPGGPDPAPPNDMLAPFWTDLDGTGAPGILVGTLTDGVNTWLVVEYRVNVFGTADQRVFQVWIGVDGTQDITYAYDPGNLPGDPNGQDFLVGAENELGEGDMVDALPTEDLRVTSTDPTPGAAVSYTVDVKGILAGTGVVTTRMVSPNVAGTTIVTSEVVVDQHHAVGPA